ncbi:transposase [uncultured Roseibium sp.]|uniref:transposase n=1 Tax=uncultured Roseibium sp. TaxID=1936171 RepID=UPI002622F134|nr:transposase [uncultured Roseibium sp.]
MRDPRFALDGEAADRDTAAFFPVEIEGTLSCANEPLVVSAMSAPVSAQRIDITLSDGRRILVEGPTALASVLALVEGLMP